MAIVAVPMVQAECDRCDKKSPVGTEAEAVRWQSSHNKLHELEDLIERMKLLGHECQVVGSWMDMDDSGGRVVCSCGNFRSPEKKLCWMDDYVRRHLEEVEKPLIESLDAMRDAILARAA